MSQAAADAPESEAAWLARISQARRKGDHLHAYDLSVRALQAWPGVVTFQHQAILALARAGALTTARARYDHLIADLTLADPTLDDITDRRLAEDLAALNGRLWKDFAQRSQGADALRYRLLSATAYEAAYHRFGGFYPAINAASMFLAAGRRDTALEYARTALALARQAPADDYWAIVTAAEASLVLGDFTAVSADLRIASQLGTLSLDEVAATRKQLAWVAELVGAPAETLAALVQPRVIAWISPRDTAAPDVTQTLAGSGPVIAFGPLLSAADITMARALLDAGVEVNLVLPCEAELILASRICNDRGLGDTLRDILARAASTILVTREGGPYEPAARLLCHHQAHGLAWLRAKHLGVTPTLFPPRDDGAVLGCIPFDAADDARVLDIPPDMVRQPHAILFGDVRGFSRLNEAQQLLFLTHIINGFAEVLDRSVGVEYAETAGDGLFIVETDVVRAVECGFALREVLRPEKVAAAGLPDHLALRLSAHVGPLHKRYDGVIRRDRFCGMEVIRTARIEPVTPAGEIFVTEQFAAALACVAGERYVCEYVGIQPMAKGFGECRMYSLRHAVISDEVKAGEAVLF